LVLPLTVSLGLLCFIRFPHVTDKINAAKLKFSIRVFSGWHSFRGVMIASGGFAAMTLLMHSAPIALHGLNCSLNVSSDILTWHFVAMYSPAILVGPLLSRMKSTFVIVAGVATGVLACVTGFAYPTAVPAYYVVVVLIGLSWSMLFTTGMNLLIDDQSKENAAARRGVANLVIYGVNAIASFSAAPILSELGWHGLAWIALVPLLVSLCGCYERRQHRIPKTYANIH
jgi:MFS family permease